MVEIIEKTQNEWVTVTGAPFTFLILAVLVFAAAYAASKWRFSGTIDILRERLAAKDQQLDEYRERLHLVPAHGSEFSKNSHAELKAETLKLVAALREWLGSRTSQDSLREHQQWVTMTSATDESQKKILWDAHTAELIRNSNMLKNEYDSKFKVKAIVLRDELLTRVQRPAPADQARSLYEHPTNPIGMRMVADDLEHLARLLC